MRWWVSGGRALDFHLGRSWRVHTDTDIGILRADATRLPDVLPGWDIYLAAAGQLACWNGESLDIDHSQNNLWCRPSPRAPWSLDVTVGDGDDRHWTYRRDPTIRVPWHDAVLGSPRGVPYLAPELQLLFKSTNSREKDDIDASVVIPLLDAGRRSWLAAHLPASHPWQTTIADSEPDAP